jgi:hypothetical protein
MGNEGLSHVACRVTPLWAGPVGAAPRRGADGAAPAEVGAIASLVFSVAASQRGAAGEEDERMCSSAPRRSPGSFVESAYAA